MPGLHRYRRHGRAHCRGQAGISREEVAAAVRNLLGQATAGTPWTDPHGRRHVPILVGGTVAGSLWEDADLSSLEVAGYVAAPFGAKAELSREGRVVGMVRVSL